jgi:hypothetical protein
MTTPLGQPLMGFPLTEDDGYYWGLGCGDVIGGTSGDPPEDGDGNRYAECPIHGSQILTYWKTATYADDSVERTC